jgi:hypothetical protein
MGFIVLDGVPDDLKLSGGSRLFLLFRHFTPRDLPQGIVVLREQEPRAPCSSDDR